MTNFLRSKSAADASVSVALLLMLVALYGQVGNFEFVILDDADYVYQNVMVTNGLTIEGIGWAFTSFHPSNWHPLTWLSHMLDVSLFGVDPGWHHLVNVFFHGVNSLLVYFFFRLVLEEVWPAMLIAALFLVHPLHVESVAWVAERKDLLSAFFFLVVLHCYRYYVARNTLTRYILVFFFFVLGAMSKATVVTLPLVLLLLDYWPFTRFHASQDLPQPLQRCGRYALLVEKFPLLIISAALSFMTIAAGSDALLSVETTPFYDRIMNAVVSYAVYLQQIFLPVDLAAFYPLHEIDLVRQFLPSLLLLVSVTAVLVYCRQTRPFLLMGWLWYVLMLVPVIGIIQVSTQAHADRFVYLPSIGIFLIIALILPKPGTRSFRYSLFTVPAFLSFLFFLAYLQAGYWKNNNILFHRAIDVTKNNYVAHVNLAADYTNRRMYEQAEHYARKALVLRSDRYPGYLLLGNIRLGQGNYTEAERYYRHALLKSRDNESVLNNLGIVLAKQGRETEAVEFFNRALKAKPNMLEAKRNLSRYSVREQ